MTKHIPWTEIDNFHTVRKTLAHYPELLCDRTMITYRAKVKLHGTNAGVRVDPDGTVTAFSRSNVITPENDNAGFAKWVKEREDMFNTPRPSVPYVIYGEWCGPGIQKGVAVSRIPEKIFAVFAARVGEAFEDIIDIPSLLTAFVKDIPGAYVIPWFNDEETFAVDWTADAEALQPVLDRINARVCEVEAKDPWISEVFNIDGVGEGLVMYAMAGESKYKFAADLMFKAKGEKHAVVSKTKPAQADPTAAKNLNDFVAIVVTPARLEQGAAAVSGGTGACDMKNMGAFLQWMNADLIKETSAEMAASGLDKKIAYKACMTAARNWFLAEAKKL